jgi:hypothetical protein
MRQPEFENLIFALLAGAGTSTGVRVPVDRDCRFRLIAIQEKCALRKPNSISLRDSAQRLAVVLPDGVGAF